MGDGQANYIAALGGDDYAAGEAGNDTILGGEGNDQFWGGTGADSLDGGNGYDIARYDFAASGVVARLDGGANAGEAAGDTYANIEALYGSAFGDYLIGDSAGTFWRASTAPTCSTGLAATTSCWAVVARTPSLLTPWASAPTPCSTSPPRLRQAPATTMSTSVASGAVLLRYHAGRCRYAYRHQPRHRHSAGYHRLDLGGGDFLFLKPAPAKRGASGHPNLGALSMREDVQPQEPRPTARFVTSTISIRA